jgi:hypothetical protein
MKSRRGPATVPAARLRVRAGWKQTTENNKHTKSSVRSNRGNLYKKSSVVVSEAGVSRVRSGRGSFHRKIQVKSRDGALLPVCIRSSLWSSHEGLKASGGAGRWDCVAAVFRRCDGCRVSPACISSISDHDCVLRDSVSACDCMALAVVTAAPREAPAELVRHCTRAKGPVGECALSLLYTPRSLEMARDPRSQ